MTAKYKLQKLKPICYYEMEIQQRISFFGHRKG